MGVIKRVALGWLVILIGLLTAHVCVPQRSGPLTLSEVLEPYFVPPFLRALVDPPGSEPMQ